MTDVIPLGALLAGTVDYRLWQARNAATVVIRVRYLFMRGSCERLLR